MTARRDLEWQRTEPRMTLSSVCAAVRNVFQIHIQEYVQLCKRVTPVDLIHQPSHQWKIVWTMIALLCHTSIQKSSFLPLSSLRYEAQQIYQDQCSDCILTDLFSADIKTIVQLGGEGCHTNKES